ncbi:Uncharacterised protein [uncultured archaeon]|nr:Uncharacterised protein [uncultured archaeon]
MLDPLMLLSIALELGVFILLALAVWKGKGELLGLSFTFLVYVFYDATRALSLDVPTIFSSIAFMLASWAALWSAWQLYSHKSE